MLGATQKETARRGVGPSPPMHSLYRKMKKSWRGVGGEGAAPPPQCTRCKECIADVDLEVLCCCCCCCCCSCCCCCCCWLLWFSVVACQVLVVVDVAAGGCGGGAGSCWGLP